MSGSSSGEGAHKGFDSMFDRRIHDRAVRQNSTTRRPALWPGGSGHVLQRHAVVATQGVPDVHGGAFSDHKIRTPAMRGHSAGTVPGSAPTAGARPRAPPTLAGASRLQHVATVGPSASRMRFIAMGAGDSSLTG